MKKIFLVLFIFLLTGVVIFGEDGIWEGGKLGFNIQPPEGWTVDVSEKGNITTLTIKPEAGNSHLTIKAERKFSGDFEDYSDYEINSQRDRHLQKYSRIYNDVTVEAISFDGYVFFMYLVENNPNIYNFIGHYHDVFYTIEAYSDPAYVDHNNLILQSLDSFELFQPTASKVKETILYGLALVIGLGFFVVKISMRRHFMKEKAPVIKKETSYFDNGNENQIS